MKNNTLILFFLCVILTACKDRSMNVENILNDVPYSSENFYTPDGNRTTAKWEPALGTMVTWLACVPHALLIELAKENHLFTTVEGGDSREEATMWFEK